MMYYMAPLEGVTDFVYRGLFDRYFGPADKYFIPFLTPAEGGKLSRRQKRMSSGRTMKGLPRCLRF